MAIFVFLIIAAVGFALWGLFIGPLGDVEDISGNDIEGFSD
jgi:hypothetical protein